MNTITQTPDNNIMIIDSAINSLANILDRIGDLHRGDRLLIQCKDDAEWTHLPSVIKTEYPHSVLRCTRFQDDLTLMIKVTVIS